TSCHRDGSGDVGSSDPACIAAPLAFGAVITGAWVALGLVARRSMRRRAEAEQRRTRADRAQPPLQTPDAEQPETIPPGCLADSARSARRSFLGRAIRALEGYRVQPETSGDFHRKDPPTGSPEGEPYRLCFRPGRKR